MEGGSVSSGGMPHRAAQHPTTQSTQLFICLAINFQHSCNAFALVQLYTCELHSGILIKPLTPISPSIHSIWLHDYDLCHFRYKWMCWEQWWVWRKLHQHCGKLLMHVWRWIHPKWWWTPVWWWVDTFLYTTFIAWNLTKSIVTRLQLLWSH